MAKAARVERAAPEEIRDLRSAIEWLKKEGDLIVTDKEVDPNLEITGIQKQLDGGCPILFNNVKGKPYHRCITNLFGDMNVINKMFGWKDHTDRTRKLAYALTHPIPPVVVDSKDAPVHEEIYEKPAEVNEFVVPIRHTDIEPELTVGSGNRLVSGEYFNGGTDLGYNRMNFRWGNVGTFQISPGSHMWQVVSKYYKDNKLVPITMNFGVPPAATLLAGAGFDYVILPQGCDEVGIAGAVQGSPLRLVKARTVDAYALADAEVVLEGYVNPRDRRFETAEAEKAGIQGRFHFHPEWAGYMGKAYKAPTFHVTAVTTRRRDSKPIIFPLGVHTLDDHNIDTTVREAAIFELCERMQPGIIMDVNIPYCMTDWGGAIIQVRKRNRIEEGWQRNFMAAILATSQGSRLVIAVSEDTDPYDMDDIMWCLTTRVNPKTDIINPLPGGRGQTFMPAERMTAGEKEWTASNTSFEGGMGIDATVPFGYENDFMRPVYPVTRVDLKKFFSEKDIQNAKSRMRGWVHSLARTGR
ncbi:MAG TPA: UbiD family decarboxylase [candidate division Zixibacteria bacterium]|nr:UbiD family decarboxylase [candidate division Zixibacteria bacterium]